MLLSVSVSAQSFKRGEGVGPASNRETSPLLAALLPVRQCIHNGKVLNDTGLLNAKTQDMWQRNSVNARLILHTIRHFDEE